MDRKVTVSTSKGLAPAVVHHDTAASRSTLNSRLFFPSIMLFGSGASALIFQILWVRQLSLIVGIDVFAITLAVSSFFAGLAAGSYLFGQFAGRLHRPLQSYALLEFLIAVTGLVSTLLLARTPYLFVLLERISIPLAWTLPVALVGIPATLMGGTIPLLLSAIAEPADQLGTQGGRLYAANTVGAIAGTLVTAYWLIPTFGISGAAVVGAILNSVSAGLAIWFSRSTQRDWTASPKSATPSSSEGKKVPFGLILYGIAGGIALGYEVVWSQIVVPWTSTRSFAFATVLAVYLAGLAIGSQLGSWRLRSVRDVWGTFAVLIASAGMIALIQMWSLGEWLDSWQTRAATFAFQISGSEQLAMSSRFLMAAGCVMFIPALLLGAAFPFALQISEECELPGRTSGRVLAVNTLGGIVGTLTTGFLLIPRLGVERSLATLAVLASLVGVVASFRAHSKSRWLVCVCGLLTIIAVSAVSPDQIGSLLAGHRKGRIVYHASGSGGTVAVIEQGSPGRKFRRLYIQGVSNSGDSMTSLRYMRLQALLPLLIHCGEPRSALVIGLGTGITAGSLLNYDGLDRRVCAELVPEVIAAAKYFEGNENAVQNPALEIRQTDGRHDLLFRSDAYDLITLEPPPPSASGVANLYSTDFYRLAKARLNSQGILAQWLPLPTQTDADTRSLVRSFLDLFPHASLWSTELHEMLLIGSPDPLDLDAQTITRRFEQPKVRACLEQIGIRSPAALLATYVCDRSGLEEYAGNAAPVTDDRPRIEYGPWTVAGDFPRTFRRLMACGSDCLVIHADAAYQAEILREQSTLHRFYEAAISAYEGDRAQWQTAMDAAMRGDPNNPYFRWFQRGDSRSVP